MQDQDTPCAGWAPDISQFNMAPYTAPNRWSDFAVGVQVYALSFATRILWSATGRRFGMCPITVRPFWRQSWPAYLTFPSIFDPWGGSTGAYSWGLVGTPSGGSQLTNLALVGYGTPPQVVLPEPVGDVTNVSIDGATVDPSTYRLDGPALVRQDGQNWPQGQDLGKPLGQVNTWSVTFTRGELVPQDVQLAAGLYAYQVAKARTGGTCVLPNRVTSITRQGVSVQAVSLNDIINKGLTGVPDVDQIITSYNPAGIKARPRVLSLDTAQFR